MGHLTAKISYISPFSSHISHFNGVLESTYDIGMLNAILNTNSSDTKLNNPVLTFSHRFQLTKLSTTSKLHITGISYIPWTWNENRFPKDKKKMLKKYILFYIKNIISVFGQKHQNNTYSISQEICTRFLLCCALSWLYIDWFYHIHQTYFTGTVAI